MYPAEVQALLRKHCHPAFASVNVIRTHYGDQVDREANRLPHGTVVFSTWNRRFAPKVVPADCIPYRGNMGAVQALDQWDDLRACWKWAQEAPLRGWISLFESLVKGGWLRPHPEISYLIGKDTVLLAPETPEWAPTLDEVADDQGLTHLGKELRR
jgi:hypothetical protein